MRSAVLAIAALVAASAAAGQATSTGVAFGIDASTVVGPYRKLWQACVGSSHASMSMRADWRASLSRASQELGLKSVRFHGIFDDDMSSYLPGTYSGPAGSNMFNTFSTFDFLDSVGMTPLMELSFMPMALMSTPHDQVPPTIMHYRGIHEPPKSWEKWDAFVEEFMTNVAERYSNPSFVVETFNEPNCGEPSPVCDPARRQPVARPPTRRCPRPAPQASTSAPAAAPPTATRPRTSSSTSTPARPSAARARASAWRAP